MITSLGIKNFKSIKELNIQLGKLTVLSGMNSSGKSTVIQGIRLLERFNHKKTPVMLPGTVDMRHMAHIPSEPVCFECVRMAGTHQMQTRYMSLASELKSEDTAGTTSSWPNPVCDEGFPNCVFIGADRLGIAQK